MMQAVVVSLLLATLGPVGAFTVPHRTSVHQMAASSGNFPHSRVMHRSTTTAAVASISRRRGVSMEAERPRPGLANPGFLRERSSKEAPRVCVVGGGWAGWGATKALCESGCAVTLIDIPDPTGSSPYLSNSGKPVEAGTRGFWKDYPNLLAMMGEEGIDINEDKVFTPFTNSTFYSPAGVEATAPVFSYMTAKDLFQMYFEKATPKDLSSKVSFDALKPPDAVASVFNRVSAALDSAGPAMLPSPLAQVLATFPLFERLPLTDRASIVGLLIATLDCLGADEATQVKYDRMSAHELFLRFGVSERLVKDFIKPTLLVGLFKPPEELSALVVMELLYYYALAHSDSFDVRWIKQGTVNEALVKPLADHLMKSYSLKVLAGCKVTNVKVTDGAASLVAFETRDGRKLSLNDVDGVVLAVGTRGMKGLVNGDLSKFDVFNKAASLNSIDVVSTRIWFDRKVPTRTPANVLSNFEALRGAGGTFFMLDQLQVDPRYTNYTDEEADKQASYLWGEARRGRRAEPVSWKDRGSVVAADFYNAGALLPLSDDDIIRALAEDLLPSAVPGFEGAKVVDSWVGRYTSSVSWFSPGSYSKRPPTEGAGEELPNVKVAGDWVRMGKREHGAKGLCQERAFVSGLEAGNSLVRQLRKSVRTGKNKFNEEWSSKAKLHKVIPVRDDEAQVKFGRGASSAAFGLFPRFWVR